MAFSTFESDHDKFSRNCAQESMKGSVVKLAAIFFLLELLRNGTFLCSGWWFNGCGHTALNGFIMGEETQRPNCNDRYTVVLSFFSNVLFQVRFLVRSSRQQFEGSLLHSPSGDGHDDQTEAMIAD